MSSAAVIKRIALFAALLLVAVPAAALASGDDVLEDCADDTELSRTYSQAEYKQALAKMPADLDEYTNCRAVIRAAQLRKANSSSGGGGGGNSSTPKRKVSKRDSESVKRKVNNHLASNGPLKVGNTLVEPGNLDSSSTLPAPLIVVLLLTLLGAVVAGGIAIYRVVIDRRNS